MLKYHYFRKKTNASTLATAPEIIHCGVGGGGEEGEEIWEQSHYIFYFKTLLSILGS